MSEPIETAQSGHGMIAFLLIFLTIFITVTGQLLAKAGMTEVGQIPTDKSKLIGFVIHSYTNWKVIAAFLCGVFASFTWIGAVSRSDISFAYPFMGLAIVLVLLLSPLIFREEVPLTRWVGVIVVCIGLWIASRG
ncbi:MAG: hypothetical protein KC931_10305 [Candidatus Omnitrophica bacterium]|nr:hypothetical protein [Candidatus Omnitrophota bacterium]